MHLQKGLVYLYTKTFLPLLLHFWNYNLSPNGQVISLTGVQVHPQTQLVRSEWYKVLKIIFIAEYLQPDKFKKPSFNPIYQVSCFSSLGDASCFHVFPGKGRLLLSARWKQIMFSGKNTIFPDNTKKIMCRRGTLWKDHIFRRSEENIIFPCIF